MEDELRQIYEQRFYRIIQSLIVVGLAAGLAILITGSAASPWFQSAVIVLIIAFVAAVVRWKSQFLAAAYVLVGGLLVLVTFILAQDHTAAPYLFIPVVSIAALLLSPTATLVIAVVSIGLTLVVTVLSGQLMLASFPSLLLPFILIVATALLVLEAVSTVSLLGDRLLENRGLLRRRTRELLRALQQLDRLAVKATQLEQQLLQAQAEPSPAAETEDIRLYSLVTGTIDELDGSIKHLRQMIERMTERPEGEEQDLLLEEAWQKVHYLSRLIIHLEEMAEIESGTIRLTHQRVEPVRLLNEVTGIAQAMARGKDISVLYRGPDELPPVPADPVRLRQALLHVLSNAVKYTDQGMVELQAELQNGELLIFVVDTGIGMYPEERQTVFEKFGRGSGTLAQQRQGTGLGLAICKGLIELHGGRVWATSALGVGSTFYIALPLEQPEQTLLLHRVSHKAEKQVMAPELRDETVVLQAAAVRPPSAQSSFGPVSRFSRSYVNRFAIALILLLLLLATAVGVLALNRRPPEESQVTPGEVASAGITPETMATSRLSTAVPGIATTTTSPSSDADPPPTPTSLLVTPGPLVTIPASEDETAASPEFAIPTPQVTATSAPLVTRELPIPTATATTSLSPTPIPATQAAGPRPEATVSDINALTAAMPLLQPGLAYLVNEPGGSQVGLAGSQTGSGLSLAPAQQTRLSWSPDGQTLVFVGDEDGNLELYAVGNSCANLDQECDAINLSRSTGDDTQPAWSPDGRRLAFSSGRSGNFDLYVVDICPVGEENCTDTPVQLTQGRAYEEWPAWSPDGRQLAYVSDEEGNVEIYIMNADGSNQQRVTHDAGADWPVDWSPDGRWLLFASDRDSNWNLYLIEADCASRAPACKGQPIRLTHDPADEREPVWSPDGQTIAFASNVNGNWEIYTIPAPGSRPVEAGLDVWTQVTDTPVDERYPVWVR